MQRPSGIAWLVAPGPAMIAVTYGLARFAYGLFLPERRKSLDLSESVLGLIGADSYAGYCFAVLGALVFTSRAGPRLMAAAAGAVAVVGMTTVASAPTAWWVLALGVLVAGSSSGLASPPMGEAVATTVSEESQDRANALINSGTSIGVAHSGPAALLVAEQWRQPRIRWQRSLRYRGSSSGSMRLDSFTARRIAGSSIHRSAWKVDSPKFALLAWECGGFVARVSWTRAKGLARWVRPLLRRSGRKEYASCPTRTKRTTRATPIVGRDTPLPRRR